ncbi:MAG: carboxymuconolactone decarboxylase family protein [Pseudomonadota bacterium]
MMQDWKTYRDAMLARMSEFAKFSPEVARGFSKMGASAQQTGHLSPKTNELIALAVAVTTRCDGCISAHTKKALEHGATREEIAEALGVAITLNAGAAYTYTARVFEAIDQELGS